jgi:hypothetical protein
MNQMRFLSSMAASQKDLPIQIKICMNDSVPHRDDLPPRHIGVAFSQFNGQAADGLAITVRWCNTAAVRTSSGQSPRFYCMPPEYPSGKTAHAA